MPANRALDLAPAVGRRLVWLATLIATLSPAAPIALAQPPEAPLGDRRRGRQSAGAAPHAGRILRLARLVARRKFIAFDMWQHGQEPLRRIPVAVVSLGDGTRSRIIGRAPCPVGRPTARS